ncbi:MAG: hypothetical protein WBC74_05155 [Candidatus Omnitrophota bacterium]
MKRVIAIVVILALTLVSMPAFAAKGRKGASDRAYERANKQAIFHRVGDWFATRGKSKEEKEAILTERNAKREAARAQKEAEKKKKTAEKERKERQKQIKERHEQMKEKHRQIRKKHEQRKEKQKQMKEKHGAK